MTTSRIERHMRSDVDVVDAISRAFDAADDVQPEAIHVWVANGRAALRGTVASHAERLAATRHAAAVAGVREVDNLLVVRSLDLDTSRMSDEEVTQSVARAILSSTVAVEGLGFTILQHVVTLAGTVASRRARAALHHAVQNAPGVHFVHDHLTVVEPAAEAVEELDVAACYDLLATQTLGRLAVQDEAGVDVFPLNYVLRGSVIYFRSGPGTKMIRLTDRPDVAFEVDGKQGRLAWSVVVRGVAKRLGMDTEISASGIDDEPSAHPTDKFNYVKITPQQVSGRRFVAKPRAVPTSD